MIGRNGEKRNAAIRIDIQKSGLLSETGNTIAGRYIRHDNSCQSRHRFGDYSDDDCRSTSGDPQAEDRKPRAFERRAKSSRSPPDPRT